MLNSCIRHLVLFWLADFRESFYFELPWVQAQRCVIGDLSQLQAVHLLGRYVNACSISHFSA